MSSWIGKVELREPFIEDRELLFRMSQDPIANEMAKVFAPSREWFDERWDRSEHDPLVVARTILFNGEVVGKINSFPMDGQPHIGYLIDQSHWGRGIATRALRAFLEIDKTRPMHARAASTNLGSIKVLENCGFVKTGQRDSLEDERYMACIEVIFELA